MDFFNLGKIDKNVLTMIRELTILSEECKEYAINPCDIQGEKIIQNIENISKNLVDIKENIAKMISVIEY